MASAISTLFSPKKSNELCDRLKLLIQEKQVGNNSEMNNEEIVATAHKILEYKCISTRQVNFLNIKCLN